MALRCPRLFHYRYIEKLPEIEVMPEARIGKAIHTALELVLQNTPLADAFTKARDKLPAPDEQTRFDELAAGVPAFLERIAQFRKQRRVQRQLIEYRLAVREDLTTTQFYAGDAYYRGVLDAGYIFDDDLALLDHKSGVRYPGTSIRDQLDSYAVLASAWWRPAGKRPRIWLGVHWVAERAVEWATPLSVQEIEDRLVPELLDNIEAAALAVSDGPRLNPGPYCDRCSYRSICPAGTEQRYEAIEYTHEDDD